MKTLFRTVLSLALIVWLGAEIFFPVVAAVTFKALQPDTHMAGAIVGHLLRILHGMGLACGGVALVRLARAPALGIYKPRAVLAPMALLAVMIGLTVYSQFGILPAMERDRIAAGGAIDSASVDNSSRVDFEKLHKRSVYVEETVLLLGLATVVLVARAETGKYREQGIVAGSGL
jgi:hypothetical protein